MAGRVQWRRFGFFDRDTVTDNIEGTLGSSPTCASADGGILLFGDDKGNISMTDRNFNISWTHRAFAGPVRGVAYVYDLMNHKRQYVVAVGEEPRPISSSESKTASTREPYVIKVFVTSDLTHPIQAFLASNPTVQDNSTLTGFSVTSNGYQIALGFSSGAILLFSGNFLAEGSVGRQFNPQTLLHGHKYAVTGLYFCELNFNSIKTSTSDRNVRLFAVLGGEASGGNSTTQQPHSDPEIADAGILAFDTSFSTYGGGIGSAINRTPTRVLDFVGATSQCSSLMKQTYELVVGREEGVFTYSIEDRGGAAGFEGEKQCIAAVGRYILVGCIDDKTKRTLITIYDLRNKFISMSYLLPLNETIRMVLSDGGVAYVITSSWSLIRFREKDTASKLDVLLRKSLYPLAISLAAEEQSDVNEVMRLYKMYADHLYKKNDFDGSILQYCSTIGFIQPSYVIKRFLDTQRINNLTIYLEKLHYKNLATKDHTTLLLTCYTKTNNIIKLNEFCQMNNTVTYQSYSSHHDHESKMKNGSNTTTTPPTQTSGGGTSSGGTGAVPSGSMIPLNYDVLTAIYTLHDAGFDEHALRLSVLNHKHEEYLHILLSSKTNKKDLMLLSSSSSSSSSFLSAIDHALIYLVAIITFSDLSISIIIDIIYKFGSLFLLERPIAFTSLLIQLCVGTLDRQKIREILLKESTTTAAAAGGGAGAAGGPNDSSSSSAFSSSILEVESEVENLLTQRSKEGAETGGAMGGGTGKHKKGSSSTPNATYLLADCFPLEDALAVYADDEKYLRIFIEGVNEGMRKVNATMPSRLTELLLELYLVEYQEIRDLIQSSKEDNMSGNGESNSSNIIGTGSLSTSHTSHVELLNRLKSIEDKVLAILDGASSVNTEYDISNALLLMHSFNFENGELFLIEKLQSTDLILRRCIETGNERGIMRILKREGRKDPELFVQVLTYFVRLSMTSSSSSSSTTAPPSSTSSGTTQQHTQGDKNHGGHHGGDSDDDDDEHHYDDDDERWELINEVLQLVERENVLTPMQIIPILSANPDLPLHLASRFIKRTLKETSDELITLERDVSHMKRIVQGVIQEGIAARQHKLNQQAAAEISSGGISSEKKVNTIRGGNMTSSRTGSSMTTSSVSENEYYHDHGDEDELERQQAEAEREVERTKWLGIKKAQEKRTNDHESFFGELEHCSDGFGTIAAYFGKTLIS